MEQSTETEAASATAPVTAEQGPSAVRLWRILVLPAAAIVLLAVCFYKTTRDYSRPTGTPPAPLRTAPSFTLLDSQSPQEMVRLETWLGRHPILLIFYDGQAGVTADPRIEQARRMAAEIEQAGAKILAVSTALPQQNRAAVLNRRTREPDYAVPFPLLTDLPPATAVHRQWGAVDAAGQPVPAVFVIDRGGRVPWQGMHPVPASGTAEAIRRLLSGS